ncbi:MAG: nicotinamidase/pyrazinamidase [Acidimicrobiaceae bacterium]|nr:nicotinamidase/pyrazinamidase [Acidimicrobiaceae bacterium]
MTENRLNPYEYDRSTALIVVDLQNDFADPAGSLHVNGGEHLARLINAEIATARKAGSFVVYTQDWHPPHTAHFVTDGGVWPVHCVAGTWGAAFPADLQVMGPSVRKGTGGEDGYSGFTVQDQHTGERQPTSLEGLLRDKSIGTVVVAGLATDYCVKETALDAVALGFRTVVARSAILPVDLKAGDGDRAIDDMTRGGVIVA